MVTVRPAGREDSQALWEWRNDAATRAASVETGPVAWEDHQRWLEHSLSTPTRTLLIAIDELGESVGMVRFDVGADATATVSINLAPANRGKGLGGPVLRSAIEWFLERHAGTALVAVVRTENGASQRLFAAEGFAFESQADGFTRLTRLR